MLPENYFSYADDKPFAGKSTEEVFQEIFEKNHWEQTESVSGPGSSLEQTREIVKELPEVLATFQVNSLLDVPCGDFNWMRAVDFGKTTYLGADIVEALVAQNQATYGSPLRQFRQLNLLEDALPTVDLIFSRDCLVHFSFADTFRAIANFKKSGSTYLMTTTFPKTDANTDIHTGGWRTLNLQLAPFFLPEPLLLLNEKCTERSGYYADKSLAVWRLADM